jgi:hypothetical protein
MGNGTAHRARTVMLLLLLMMMMNLIQRKNITTDLRKRGHFNWTKDKV